MQTIMIRKILFFLAAMLIACCNPGYAQEQPGAKVWLTNPDRSALFQEQRETLTFQKNKPNGPTIDVDAKKGYQTMDGFGFALTGGSAMHIIRMSPESRSALLKELFATDGNNIGISYLRLSIGASDLNEKIFSYDDLPVGQTDTAMAKFDLGPDRADVIPVLKEILTINPHILILGSPWSAPVWMKTNNDTRGGSLKPEFYPAYAKYFVRYIKDMKEAGIRIDAITVQNEPLHPGNNPSLLMLAPDQGIFVKNHLGPAFKAANLDTKIIIYDHNADRPDYPMSILDDPGANKFIDGSGFHLYNGKIEALMDVHNAHPDKNLYFTEQMVVDDQEDSQKGRIRIAQPVSRLFIGATRNWCKNVLEWNLAADPQFKPFTDRGGCPMCQGAVTIDKNAVTRNLAYYAMAHASKFVRPGSVRISSNGTGDLANVAFQTPDGKKVLIVANTGPSLQSFTIRDEDRTAVATLQAGAVATYVW
ncbi:glycoside hydrolase family 30 protein [Flavitalea flava]